MVPVIPPVGTCKCACFCCRNIAQVSRRTELFALWSLVQGNESTQRSSSAVASVVVSKVEWKLWCGSFLSCAILRLYWPEQWKATWQETSVVRGINWRPVAECYVVKDSVTFPCVLGSAVDHSLSRSTWLALIIPLVFVFHSFTWKQHCWMNLRSIVIYTFSHVFWEVSGYKPSFPKVSVLVTCWDSTLNRVRPFVILSIRN